MRLFEKAKDGGPESKVEGLFLVEWKRLFSIILLHFSNGSREAYHDHAFNSISWLLKGHLREHMLDGRIIHHTPSLWPIVTRRRDFHKAVSMGDSWALTFRGPWVDKWHERDMTGRYVTLTNGRKVAV